MDLSAALSGLMARFRKDKASLTPDNRMEVLLIEVLKDKSRLPAFYKELLKSEVYVLGNLTDADGEGEKVMIRGAKIMGKPAIPVFTSLQRLSKFVKKQEQYVKISAKGFFNMIDPGMEVVMNPNSDIAKPFTREEIDQLVAEKPQK